MKIAIPVFAGQEWVGGKWLIDGLIRSLARLGPDRPKVDLVFTTKSFPIANLFSDLLPFIDGIWIPDKFLGQTTFVSPERTKVFKTLAEVPAAVDFLFPFVPFGAWLEGEAVEATLQHPHTIVWVPDLLHAHTPASLPDMEVTLRRDQLATACKFAKRVAASSFQDCRTLYQIFPDRQFQFFSPKLDLGLPPTPVKAEDVKRKYDLPERYFYCPYPIFATKDHLTLLGAVYTVGVRGKPIPHLVCSGKMDDPRVPTYAEKIKEFIDAGQIASNVKMLGYIPREDQLSIMIHADAVVLAAPHDGWSTPIEEARVLGAQCLCADSPWYIEQAPCGTIFSPRRNVGALTDALLRVLDRQPPQSTSFYDYAESASQAGQALVRFLQEETPTRASALFSRKAPLHRSQARIVTSFSPRGIPSQLKAVESWRALGFNVEAVNFSDEAPQLKSHFEMVEFSHVPFEQGKPRRIPIDALLERLRRAPEQIGAIVNSDIVLRAPQQFIDFVCEESKDALIIVPRFEVESQYLSNASYCYQHGFDAFFFPKAALDLIPATPFALGLPWWDYFLPLVLLNAGFKVKRLTTPVAYHATHNAAYSEEKWYELGHVFTSTLFPDLSAEGTGNLQWGQVARIRNAARYSIRILWNSAVPLQIGPRVHLEGTSCEEAHETTIVIPCTTDWLDWNVLARWLEQISSEIPTWADLLLCNVSGLSVPEEICSLLEAKFPRALIVQSANEGNVCCAFNIAAHVSRSRFIAPVFAGSYVVERDLQEGLNQLRRDPALGIVFAVDHETAATFAAIRDGRTKCHYFDLPAGLMPLAWNREVVLKCGGFDESLPYRCCQELILRRSQECKWSTVPAQQSESLFGAALKREVSGAAQNLKALLTRYLSPYCIGEIVRTENGATSASARFAALFNNVLGEIVTAAVANNETEIVFEVVCDTSRLVASLEQGKPSHDTFRANMMRFLRHKDTDLNALLARFIQEEGNIFLPEDVQRAQKNPTYVRL